MVTGLELSPIAVDQARAVAEEHGIDASFEAVDLSTWNPDGEEWDLVVLAYLQLPAETRRPIHAAAATAVAPGGRLIVIAHHRDNLDQGVGGPPYPEVLFTEDELAEDFAALDIERNERVLRATDHGDAIDVVLVASRSPS